MSLVKHPALAGKLVHAWTEPAKRDTRDGEHGSLEDTRFRFVVDESDSVLGVVTEQYRLVRNADFVSAAELAAAERGIVLEPTEGKLSGYNAGRSKYCFHMPSLEYKVGRDSSPTSPMLALKNNYRGDGGIAVQSGYYRLICTNGAMRGTIAYRDWKRHTGNFDLMAFVGGALDRLLEIFEADRLVAETLANTPVIAGGELLETLMKDTAARYRPDLERAVRHNTLEMGENAWAYLQAGAEVATHRMQERSRFNLAADPWLDRVEALIRQHVER